MNQSLDAIFQRRAVKVFEPVEISQGLREQVLDAARHAPSSFNIQPYRFYWVESAAQKAVVAKLCLGQKPAETASALVVAVADIGSMSATTQGQAEWMRRNNFGERKIRDYERTAKIGRVLFMPGAIRLVRRSQTRSLPVAEPVEGDRNAAAVPSGHIQMGNEGNIVGLREFDDRCRSAGIKHVSDGRL